MTSPGEEGSHRFFRVRPSMGSGGSAALGDSPIHIPGVATGTPPPPQPRRAPGGSPEPSADQTFLHRLTHFQNAYAADHPSSSDGSLASSLADGQLLVRGAMAAREPSMVPAPEAPHSPPAWRGTVLLPPEEDLLPKLSAGPVGSPRGGRPPKPHPESPPPKGKGARASGPVDDHDHDAAEIVIVGRRRPVVAGSASPIGERARPSTSSTNTASTPPTAPPPLPAVLHPAPPAPRVVQSVAPGPAAVTAPAVPVVAQQESSVADDELLFYSARSSTERPPAAADPPPGHAKRQPGPVLLVPRFDRLVHDGGRAHFSEPSTKRLVRKHLKGPADDECPLAAVRHRYRSGCELARPISAIPPGADAAGPVPPALEVALRGQPALRIGHHAGGGVGLELLEGCVGWEALEELATMLGLASASLWAQAGRFKYARPSSSTLAASQTLSESVAGCPWDAFLDAVWEEQIAAGGGNENDDPLHHEASAVFAEAGAEGVPEPLAATEDDWAAESSSSDSDSSDVSSSNMASDDDDYSVSDVSDVASSDDEKPARNRRKPAAKRPRAKGEGACGKDTTQRPPTRRRTEDPKATRRALRHYCVLPVPQLPNALNCSDLSLRISQLVDEIRRLKPPLVEAGAEKGEGSDLSPTEGPRPPLVVLGGAETDAVGPGGPDGLEDDTAIARLHTLSTINGAALATLESSAAAILANLSRYALKVCLLEMITAATGGAKTNAEGFGAEGGDGGGEKRTEALCCPHCVPVTSGMMQAGSAGKPALIHSLFVFLVAFAWKWPVLHRHTPTQKGSKPLPNASQSQDI